MTRLIAASITALFAEQTRSLAYRGYNPKLKAFMKKGHANFGFATSVDFCHTSIAPIDGYEFRFGVKFRRTVSRKARRHDP
jgi:hypothetical protein